jgi:hypothetical protein
MAKAPLTLEEGQQKECNITGFDQKDRPYDQFTTQLPPLISDPSAFSYNMGSGVITALPGAAGKTATFTWTSIDNIDPTKTATSVDELTVASATSFLTRTESDYSDVVPQINPLGR